MGGGEGSRPGFNASSSAGFSGSASNTRTSASCNEEVEAGAVDVDAEGSRERAASKSELRYSGVISSSSSSISKLFSGRCTSDIAKRKRGSEWWWSKWESESGKSSALLLTRDGKHTNYRVAYSTANIQTLA